MITLLLPWKKGAKILCFFKKLPKGNNRTNGEKFAQSGHPAWQKESTNTSEREDREILSTLQLTPGLPDFSW
jgi:hypothetical protein